MAEFRRAQFDDELIKSKLAYDEKHGIKLGINVIDDVFGAVLPSDIVILGAKTGSGKSDLCAQIAENVGSQNKNVYMFALEAEAKEVELRIIFKEMSRLNLILPQEKKIYKLNYKLWRVNHSRYGLRGESLRKQAILDVNKRIGSLWLYYRDGSFEIKDFVRAVMSVNKKADLIILDHIHYFDFKGSDQNKELGDAIKKIRDIALLNEVPIIVVAHLRKEQQSQDDKLMPTIDDFHGSSDLSKIGTKGVILAPGGIEEDETDGCYYSKTLFSFPKFRMESQAHRYIFLNRYNLSSQAYEAAYRVFEFKNNTSSFLSKMINYEILKSKLFWLGGK